MLQLFDGWMVIKEHKCFFLSLFISFSVSPRCYLSYQYYSAGPIMITILVRQNHYCLSYSSILISLPVVLSMYLIYLPSFYTSVFNVLLFYTESGRKSCIPTKLVAGPSWPGLCGGVIGSRFFLSLSSSSWRWAVDFIQLFAAKHISAQSMFPESTFWRNLMTLERK